MLSGGGGHDVPSQFAMTVPLVVAVPAHGLTDQLSSCRDKNNEIKLLRISAIVTWIYRKFIVNKDWNMLLAINKKGVVQHQKRQKQQQGRWWNSFRSAFDSEWEQAPSFLPSIVHRQHQLHEFIN